MTMTYPIYLLPQQNYKKIEFCSELNEGFLIHFTDTKDNKDPDTKNLKLSCVVKRTDHLRDYSNNLLGVFLTNDIYWGIENSENKGYFISEWNIGEKVKVPIVPNDVKKSLARGYFFLPIKNCHQAIVNYSDETNMKPICKVLHTPTNSNFWHFSLRWFYNDVDILNWTDKERKRILTAAKSFIIQNAKFDEPNYKPINKIHYVNE